VKLRLRRGAPPPELPLLRPLRPGDAPPAGFEAVAAELRVALDSVEAYTPRRAVLVATGAAPGALACERAAGTGIAPLLAVAGGRVALDARGFSPPLAAAFGAGALLRAWRFDALRSAPRPWLERIELFCDDPEAVAPHWQRAEAAARGTLLARDLVAEPGNRLTPRAFARRLEELAEAEGLEVEVLGRKRLAELGAGALLAVGQAAESGPYLVTLRWRGELPQAPVVFVGKGITFDTGGVSIKPAQGMEEMRADMAGAAACIGALVALARRRSPAPAAAVLAIAENAVGARSYRPGDVLRSLSGRSIEVVDTDAEGRLVLADALHFARTRLRPLAMVDAATLTGSVVVALGHHRAGLFGNDQPLMAALAASGEEVGEKLWPLPISERQRRDLDSEIADLRHCLPSGGGQGWGGRFMPDACHAAAFLREFAGDGAWAHCDIAGVEAREEADALGPKGPSGFGARLFDHLVAARFEEPDAHAAP
jgi:leucyl aminopeptidase